MDTLQNNKPEKNIVMGVLSYLGPLVIVSYATAKDDPFVKFHIKQGLVLLSIEVLTFILSMAISWRLWMILSLVNMGVFVLSIVGIINVTQGKENELPFVGSFSKLFNI